MTTDKTPATLDAVRNLIVCDTQFTWAGVTNLTMPQMMDLQARGWVVEGDSNDEFQLTEAGEAVVARALEHGAPATMATAKHGGCVQLGDGLPPLPIRQRFTTLHGETYAYSAEQMREYALAALAAQPSPGGQGDALHDAVGRIFGCDGSPWRTRDVAAVLRDYAALAARQPVGSVKADEAPFGLTTAEKVAWARGANDAIKEYAACQPVGEPVAYIEHFADQLSRVEMTMHGLQLGIGKHAAYAAPPAQVDQEYLESLDRALEGVIDQRDRYHETADDLAGHIASITGVDIGEHSSANCPWQNAIEAAEEYKPAQAVDLGQFREAVQVWLQSAVWWGRHGREKCEEAKRLLALIDSHSEVSNG